MKTNNLCIFLTAMAVLASCRGTFAAEATGRVRAVSRYSYQRPFNEYYRLPAAALEPSRASSIIS